MSVREGATRRTSVSTPVDVADAHRHSGERRRRGASHVVGAKVAPRRVEGCTRGRRRADLGEPLGEGAVTRRARGRRRAPQPPFHQPRRRRAAHEGGARAETAPRPAMRANAPRLRAAGGIIGRNIACAPRDAPRWAPGGRGAEGTRDGGGATARSRQHRPASAGRRRARSPRVGHRGARTKRCRRRRRPPRGGSGAVAPSPTASTGPGRASRSRAPLPPRRERDASSKRRSALASSAATRLHVRAGGGAPRDRHDASRIPRSRHPRTPCRTSARPPRADVARERARYAARASDLRRRGRMSARGAPYPRRGRARVHRELRSRATSSAVPAPALRREQSSLQPADGSHVEHDEAKRRRGSFVESVIG